jgi:hypothetical protein
MNRIFLPQMTDENDRDDPSQGETPRTPMTTGAPACGRVQELAGDVVGEVMQACPRCTGSGTDCLIDLMYAEAFPSQQRH